MPKTRAKKSFVVCLSNDEYAASLERGKIYVALRDAADSAQWAPPRRGRVGRGLLYSRERFAQLKLPRGL